MITWPVKAGLPTPRNTTGAAAVPLPENVRDVPPAVTSWTSPVAMNQLPGWGIPTGVTQLCACATGAAHINERTAIEAIERTRRICMDSLGGKGYTAKP